MHYSQTQNECWHGLTLSHINQLEIVDKFLLRRILKIPSSTPTESMYLDLGMLRIGTIKKARRINFLHYLLRRNETEIIYQIFSVQWNHFVKQDLIDFRIDPDLLNLT